MNKKKTSFTLSEKADSLLKKLSEKLGLSMAGVIEIAIREKAKKEDIERPGNKAHPSQGETYNQWLNSLRWTEDNYIGRLEYELKRGYIEKYFKEINKN